MKSKFNLTLLLIGFIPVLALGGVYFWSLFNEAPAKAVVVNTAAVQTTLPMLQAEIQTISSSMFNNIKKTDSDISELASHNTDADLSNFVKNHPGISGVAVLSLADGKVQKTIPAAPSLVDPAYGTSEEFQKIISKFKENGNTMYQFYTQRLGYPSFIFAVPVSSQSFAEAVLNLGTFFRDIDPKSGEIFLLDAGSGRYLYHSNPAKLLTLFNPNQEPWLTKVQTDLSAQQGGTSENSPTAAAVYGYLGFGKFGVVHTIPFAALQPSAPVTAKPSLDNWQELIKTPMSLALVVTLGWLFLVGTICSGMILNPLRRASQLVLNAAEGKIALTPESAQSFGNNEVGQMVQAASLLIQKSQQEQQRATQEKETAIRNAKNQLDEKTRDAATQISTAQQQAKTVQNELNDKNQQLNDKLKELDALKSMSEGLRNQSEQSKAENAKLKGQLSTTETARDDFQKKLTDVQTQMKDMEAKLLLAVASSSAIQVSQVRAAAIRTMSEELKTTLGIIKGYVSSALGTTQGGISEKQQEFLGMVINRSARLEKFINDLVDIYQVEIEQETAKTEEVNLASEIEGLAFNFQAQAEVKNIKMKIEGKPNLPNVPIVRRRFNQLWNILYLQIIKDSPRNSTIPINIEPIGDNVKVTIQDPGLIVAAESMPRLFDEFYDPKHPASPQLAGTGLKFALVKTILAAHGGGAVAEKIDPGTRLTLTFPTKIKKAGAAPSAAAPGAKPAAPTAVLPKPAIPSAASLTGTPKPAVPPLTAASKPAGGGVLDALISGKVPPVSAPGVKPPAPAAGSVPSTPPSPAATPKAPIPLGGLEALLDKKPQPPASSGPVVPSVPSVVPPKPVTPAAGTPGIAPPPAPRPAVPPVPGVSAPGASVPPKPAAPIVGAPGAVPPPTPRPAAPPAPGVSAPGAPVPPKPAAPVMGVPGAVPPPAPRPVAPPVPGVSASGAPVMPPKPAAPLMGTPGIVSSPIPRPAAPPIPGVPAPGVPAAPKVIPTSVKPTTPPPGILDMDTMDSFKVDAIAPPPPKPAVPPLGAPKPPMPGMPPGGLDASKATKPKEDGDLIE